MYLCNDVTVISTKHTIKSEFYSSSLIITQRPLSLLSFDKLEHLFFTPILHSLVIPLGSFSNQIIHAIFVTHFHIYLL